MSRPIFENADALCKYFHFEPKSKADVKRLAKAWEMYASDYRGDGCMGCIAEMLTATKGSHKMAVSTQGKTDDYVNFINDNGIRYSVKTERKTNGGRVNNIAEKYVVYSMDVCNKNTGYCRRKADAIIVPTDLFMSKLYELDCIKEVSHDHVVDGLAIQVTKKEWWLWVSEYPVKFDRERAYTKADFIGLK